MNLLKKYNWIIIILFLLFSFLYISLIVPTYFVQDEAATYFSSKNFIETNDFYLNNDLNDDYNTNLLKPSYSSYNKNEEVQFNIPKSVTLLYSMFYLIFGEFTIYSNLIFSFLILLILYLFLRKIYPNKKHPPLISLFIVAFMPIFLIYSISLFSILPAIFLILLIFYLLLYFDIGKLKILFLISILSNLLIYFRLSEFLIFSPVFLYLFFTNKKNTKKIKNFIILICMIFSLFVIFNFPISINSGGSLFESHFLDKRDYISLNEEINLISFPSTYNHTFLERAIAYPLGTEVGFEGFTFENYFQNLSLNLKQFLFVGPFPIFLILFISLIFILFEKSDFSRITKLSIFVFFILFLFYGPRINYYGFGEENLKSSFYRYFLVFYLLLALFLPRLTCALKKKLNLRSLILAVFFFTLIYITFFINYSFSYNYNGVVSLNDQRHDQLEVLEKISSIESSSFFLTGYNTDRYLYFPNSNVSYSRVISYDVGEYYYNSPLEEDLFNESKRVISNLLKDGYNIYLVYSPYDSTNQERYINYLNKNFIIYKTNIISNENYVSLYKVEL